MQNKADLHIHTSASDGVYSPSKIVAMAKQIGLGAIGICDHDTINGLDEGLKAGEQQGLIVVPGIEINTDFGQNELHILGYYIDLNSPILNERLNHLRSERLNRGIRIVNKLNQAGINISMDKVQEIADGATIGRPHIARTIIDAGYASSLNSAFGKYLVRGTPGYVERYKLTPIEAIKIITDSNGIPVMAHPGNCHKDEVIPQLVNAGLKGIEVYHSDHTSHQRKHYKQIAEKYKLIATGGSDYHGPNVIHNITIGNATCDITVVDQLKQMLNTNFIL